MEEFDATRHADDVALVQRCLSGDARAIAAFQDAYGALVYRFPGYVYRLPAEEAGAFYVYAFEDGRIFRRARSYRGRASLHSFLSGYVLDHLLLEWRRRERPQPLVSLEVVPEPASPEATTPSSFDDLLDRLSTEKALVLKLLFIEDHELSSDDLRAIARQSGRSLRDVVDRIESLRRTVRRREQSVSVIEDALGNVHSRVQLYERRLAAIDAEIAPLPASSAAARRLHLEREEIARKLANRRRQRSTTLADLRRRKATAPYKDIAALLNTSINNVASRIRRVKSELTQQSRKSDLRKRRDVSE